MRRLLFILLMALPLAADCSLPDANPYLVISRGPRELVDTGHYRRAIELLDPFVRSHADNAAALWLLSRAKAATGDLEIALALADQALAINDSVPEFHEQAALVAGKIAQSAPLLKQLTMVKRAKKELDAAAALRPADPAAQFGLMMFYYAAPAIAGGDKARARQIGEHVAEANPALGYYYLGKLAEEMKDFAAAESDYRKSLESAPNRFDTLAALAKLYEEDQPDISGAEEVSCRLVHADPSRGEAWARLARAYTLCGCWDKADAVMERALLADPQNPMALYSFAAGAIRHGEKLDVAADDLTRYLAHDSAEGDSPTPAEVHWQLGLLHEKQGEMQQAAQELESAIAQSPALEVAKTDLKRVNSEQKR